MYKHNIENIKKNKLILNNYNSPILFIMDKIYNIFIKKCY
jgi:hypothetical protein